MSTTEKTVELLPCAHCASLGYVVLDRHAGNYKVKCTGCEIQTKPSIYRSETITAWNTRASPPPGNREAVLEALEAMLDHYGPAGSLRDTLEYPAGHPITLTRAAIRALKTTPNTTTADHGGEVAPNDELERAYGALRWIYVNGMRPDYDRPPAVSDVFDEAFASYRIAQSGMPDPRHDTEGAGQ